MANLPDPPPNIDVFVFEDYLGNRRFFPKTVPQTASVIEMEQWYLKKRLEKDREILGKTIKGGKIQLSEELLRLCPDKEKAALLLVNAVAPEGIVEIEDYGILIAPSGKIKADKTGKPAVKAVFDIGLSEKLAVQILPASIEVFSFPEETDFTAKLSFFNGLSINGKTEITLEGRAKSAKIIFDTRGRPL